MFDCHRAEITVMLFTGHSLSVHPSMTVPGDFTLSHIVSQTRPRQWNMHFRCLWNGMFDCHRAEITVMQFTGHSLPVHQSMNIPQILPYPILSVKLAHANGICTSAGMACLAGSEVNIQRTYVDDMCVTSK